MVSSKKELYITLAEDLLLYSIKKPIPLRLTGEEFYFRTYYPRFKILDNLKLAKLRTIGTLAFPGTSLTTEVAQLKKLIQAIKLNEYNELSDLIPSVVEQATVTRFQGLELFNKKARSEFQHTLIDTYNALVRLGPSVHRTIGQITVMWNPTMTLPMPSPFRVEFTLLHELFQSQLAAATLHVTDQNNFTTQDRRQIIREWG